ncbi:uncharacterized protein N7498_006022 [Penicillium cinerascens]|uniref:Uncharacterized protein n=1 Tax=Penicillium cinerascens TaxID=70096 RepID=A0A9W9MHE0_9EURO|nr:uncharacterized protein N7498_006022 [Penicillium cinerascens]KAJ5201359.1 hypothetical protein N7498_006022 [Penicillium cinerascens]
MELRKRGKILALTSHLNAHIGHLERISEEQGRMTPSDSSKLQQYSRDIVQVSRDYCEHIQRLQNLERTKPPGKLASEFLLKRECRPHARWKLEKIASQLRWGCCLRQCRCCERWSAIQIDTGSAKTMHFDNDCDCCARYNKPIATTPVPATTLATTSIATTCVA